MKQCLAGAPADAFDAAVIGQCSGRVEAMERGKTIANIAIVILGLIHFAYMVAIGKALKSGSIAAGRKIFKFAMIPVLSPGILCGIPFGIWGFIASRDKGYTESV